MQIEISRAKDGLRYEIDMPAEVTSNMVFEELAKQSEMIEEFFEHDKDLNAMQLIYN